MAHCGVSFLKNLQSRIAFPKILKNVAKASLLFSGVKLHPISCYISKIRNRTLSLHFKWAQFPSNKVVYNNERCFSLPYLELYLHNQESLRLGFSNFSENEIYLGSCIHYLML